MCKKITVGTNVYDLLVVGLDEDGNQTPDSFSVYICDDAEPDAVDRYIIRINGFDVPTSLDSVNTVLETYNSLGYLSEYVR